jgi:hypothetical protein
MIERGKEKRLLVLRRSRVGRRESRGLGGREG